MGIPIERILAAAARAGPHVARTPVLELGGQAFLKLESLQPTGSFKVRGFFAAALALAPERRAPGLLTVSAGNAAQAAAYAAWVLGVPCRVLMYDTAPAAKSAGVRRWGGVPVLMPRPQVLDWMAGRKWEAEPEAFIHGFADEEVMAGNGGLGLELIEQVPGLARVVVPVGGGGLIAGVASALKARRPEIEVIGVQSDGYPLWERALRSGADPRLTPQTIADGTSAPFDATMLALVPPLVDRWLLVPEARVRVAVAELARRHRVIAEGAGALAYAGLEQLGAGGATVAVVSGGNIDGDRLSELLAASAG